jgi:uncharacterized protein YraI
MKNSLKTAAFGALLGAAGLAFAATGASAYVVCNADGECWHTHDQYAYPASVGVVVHDDNWRWEQAHDARVHYRWHEHDGRGYWHNNTWIAF